MRVPRLYQTIPLSVGADVELDEQAAHHVVHVLRLKPGAELAVFNGAGGEYRAVLREAHKRGARITVGDYVERHPESPLELVLAQAVSRGERMDYTIQKAVELGVRRIVPLETARTVVSLDGERRARRMQHWRDVVRNACEQSGRTLVPELDELSDFSRWLPQSGTGQKIVLHHAAAHGLMDLVDAAKSVTLLVGPEGGWETAEIEQAQRHGFTPVRLGPRVLRTETAGVVALAALQLKWGDLG